MLHAVNMHLMSLGAQRRETHNVLDFGGMSYQFNLVEVTVGNLLKQERKHESVGGLTGLRAAHPDAKHVYL